MQFDPALLAVVAGFAILANRLVAGLITPLFDHYGWDKFPLLYISWVLAGALVFMSGANLFAAFIPNVLFGQVLTAIVAGGGGNLLHDLTDQKSTVLVANIPPDADADLPIDKIIDLSK